MPVTGVEFRRALSRFTTGVTVVTTRSAAGEPVGMTASAFSSVSLDPPLVLVCVDLAARAHDAIAAHRWFAVNVLSDRQEALSRRFASPVTDKFTDVDFRVGRADLPLLDDVLAVIVCRLVHDHRAGDHTIFVGQVEEATVAAGNPLLYFRGGYRALGPARPD